MLIKEDENRPVTMLIVEGEYQGMDTAYKNVQLPTENGKAAAGLSS